MAEVGPCLVNFELPQTAELAYSIELGERPETASAVGRLPSRRRKTV